MPTAMEPSTIDSSPRTRRSSTFSTSSVPMTGNGASPLSEAISSQSQSRRRDSAAAFTMTRMAMTESYPLEDLDPQNQRAEVRGPASIVESSNIPEDVPYNEPEYPDGGFGWVITLCGFVLCFLTIGLIYAWGVIQAELAKQQLGSSLQLSLIGAVTTFFQAICALPASWCIRKFGVRAVATAAISGFGASLALAGFATKSLAGLIILQGVTFGTCSAATFMCAYVTPTQFFLKKRGLAAGLVSCGGGLGGAVWSTVIQRLINAWGLPWTYRFMGLVCLLFGIPAALTLRPGIQSSHEHGSSALTSSKSIFRSSRYVRVMAASFIASYPFFIPPFYIAQYATSVGYSADTGAFFSAVFNIASAVGRIGFGVLADFALGNINAYMLSILFIVLSTLTMWPFALREAVIYAFVIICGLGSGGFFALQSSIVGQIIGSHRVDHGVAVLEAAESLGFFAGPISAGALLDAFGGPSVGVTAYRPAMYLVGSTTALALFLVASVRISSNRNLWAKI